MRKSTFFGLLLILVGGLSLFWFAWGDAHIGTEYKVEQVKKQANDEEITADDISDNIKKSRSSEESDVFFDENGDLSIKSNDGSYDVDENGYPVSHDESVTYDVSNIEYSNDPPTNGLNVSYVVGMIYVPDVSVVENIYEGMSNDNLWAGVGTVKPNQEMGKRNYGIAGHHMENPNLLFSPLMYSQKGQTIYLSDKHTVYQYKIYNIVHVAPSEGQYMLDSQGDEIVTLVTCTDPWGTQRRIIQGELVKSFSIKDAPEHVKNVFK